MVDYASVINILVQDYPDALAVVIIDSSGNVLHSTDNWDVSRDIGRVLTSWRMGNAQFVILQDVKYSIIQMEPERLIATNFKRQGHLVGAAAPDGGKFLIAYISPDAEAWNHTAYPSVARAAAMLSGASHSTGVSVTGVTQSASLGAAQPGQSSVDPTLKTEIENFLSWIKDPQGLAGYVSYYLQINDSYTISQLAEIYNDFRRIFNF
ncbi:MAG: hypothetical protein JW776_02535 [Candidatus Lokiarchaeota archaeon]|nr:hypothetical protein [Candidatus Lokiarchaeota archaeon]